jgi:hypothetical protein
MRSSKNKITEQGNYLKLHDKDFIKNMIPKSFKVLKLISRHQMMGNKINLSKLKINFINSLRIGRFKSV